MSNSRNNCNAFIRTKTNELLAGCKTSTIPSDVTSIHRWAFQWCTGLESVTIPQSVTKIGKGAFQFCDGLSVINSYPNPAEVEMGDGVFSLEVVNNCVLHVLPDYTTVYQAAEQWKDFSHIVGDLSDALIGDVTGDGNLDVTDVVAIANYVMGDSPGTFVVENADVSGDGNVDITDVVKLANIVMGE